MLEEDAMAPSLEEIRAQFPAIDGDRATGDRFLDAAGGSEPRALEAQGEAAAAAGGDA